MSFESNFINARKVISASLKVADSYDEIHFWEQPNENTFNAKLCRELGMNPNQSSIKQILHVVNDWNVHKTLKSLYKGEIYVINPTRKF